MVADRERYLSDTGTTEFLFDCGRKFPYSFFQQHSSIKIQVNFWSRAVNCCNSVVAENNLPIRLYDENTVHLCQAQSKSTVCPRDERNHRPHILSHVSKKNTISCLLFHVQQYHEWHCWNAYKGLRTKGKSSSYSTRPDFQHATCNYIFTQALEPKTWQRLEILKIEPFYYSFRWITLLFSQEFELF